MVSESTKQKITLITEDLCKYIKNFERLSQSLTTFKYLDHSKGDFITERTMRMRQKKARLWATDAITKLMERD